MAHSITCKGLLQNHSCALLKCPSNYDESKICLIWLQRLTYKFLLDGISFLDCWLDVEQKRRPFNFWGDVKDAIMSALNGWKDSLANLLVAQKKATHEDQVERVPVFTQCSADFYDYEINIQNNKPLERADSIESSSLKSTVSLFWKFALKILNFTIIKLLFDRFAINMSRTVLDYRFYQNNFQTSKVIFSISILRIQ